MNMDNNKRIETAVASSLDTPRRDNRAISVGVARKWVFLFLRAFRAWSTVVRSSQSTMINPVVTAVRYAESRKVGTDQYLTSLKHGDPQSSVLTDPQRSWLAGMPQRDGGGF